uniref:Superoxide dismutase [Cu-Zn] n=1 Tax=Mucochytrium quahogii TaxID=96639 RepID=A0A7S2WCP0_9STRA|mmetsp:Transcript_11627/g.21225  ORF Transcript_11627/g.21225 Transcript_11627/m.21225 type:complete len:187 (-) Transcript_11627:59-619(-)
MQGCIAQHPYISSVGWGKQVKDRTRCIMSGTRAVCVLTSDQGVSGVLTFRSRASGGTHVTGSVDGLNPGMHGFHIHQFGDTTNGCASCGGHFNPEGKTHGGPNDLSRHVGDLGNVVTAANGTTKVDIVDSKIELSGPHSIIGRGLVVHAGEDDLGKGGNEESLKTGNAGGRVACGVIAAAAESSKF